MTRSPPPTHKLTSSRPMLANGCCKENDSITREHRTQVGMDVSKMDGEAIVEDERTKLYSKAYQVLR